MAVQDRRHPGRPVPAAARAARLPVGRRRRGTCSAWYPGHTVDVYVDGARALDDFAPRTVTDDLSLTAGSYEVEIFPADAADGSGTPLVAATLEVPASGNVSAIAHLSAAGEPTIVLYVNDVDETPAGQGRLVVRHTAAAAAVDMLAGGTAVFSGLTNPGEEAAELPAGTVSASVALAGTTASVIGPTDVPVESGQVTIVYAIGSATDSTLDMFAQTLDAGAGAPGGVPAGTGGLLDEGGPSRSASSPVPLPGSCSSRPVGPARQHAPLVRWPPQEGPVPPSRRSHRVPPRGRPAAGLAAWVSAG